MSKRKVTFSLENDVVETLRMMSTLTSQEQSSIVTQALTEYFEKLGSSSGKSAPEFMAFMREARSIASALRPEEDSPVPHSQIPIGSDEETRSALPGDPLPNRTGHEVQEVFGNQDLNEEKEND